MQSAAVTTGLNVAAKIFQGEKVDTDEMVEIAIKTGADTSIKAVTAGTLEVAVRKGIIRCIPKVTPAGVIANIACVGIENVKVLGKIATGELSVTKGLDQMGRVTTSMVGGLCGMAKGAIIGAGLMPIFPAVGGVVGGMIGYLGGSKIGEAIYTAGKKVASAAKTVAKAAVNGLKSVGSKIASGVSNLGNKVASFFGF